MPHVSRLHSIEKSALTPVPSQPSCLNTTKLPHGISLTRASGGLDITTSPTSVNRLPYSMNGTAFANDVRHESANCDHGSKERLFEEDSVWKRCTCVSSGLSAFHTLFFVRGVRQRSLARDLEGSLLQHQVRDLRPLPAFTHRRFLQVGFLDCRT